MKLKKLDGIGIADERQLSVSSAIHCEEHYARTWSHAAATERRVMVKCARKITSEFPPWLHKIPLSYKPCRRDPRYASVERRLARDVTDRS
jgi:hypothetical protein